MTIFGKLLIVLNLLAAGAFAYVTLENWKVRKDLTRAAISRSILLDGLPVGQPAAPPAGLDADETAFAREVNKVPYDRIPKAVVDATIPRGDETFGGPAVYDQTEEVKRVQAAVFKSIPAAGGQNPNLRYQWLRGYLLAVARTGSERDGMNAVFDLRDPSRAYAARRDLPLAARTDSQTAALRALVAVADLGPDPQNLAEGERAARIATAREAVKRFARGEVPIGAGTADAQSQEWRTLANAVEAALGENAGAAQRDAAASAAKDKDFAQVAAVAVEPLADRASADRAAAALLAYATAKAVTNTEKVALGSIHNLIRPPVQGFNLDAEVDSAATNLLNAKFDDAALPAATKAAAGGSPAGEKARKIAHLLYHIDGWRYADKNAAAARKAWHERVAAVVGLPEYVRAAEAEASEYAEAAQRLTAAITEEQSAFEAEYHAQIQRVLFLYSQWLALDAQVKAQTVINDENVRLMNERKTERDKLLEELAKARTDAKASLEKLARTQRDLFLIQKDLRDAQEALLVLEKQLRDLELRDEAARK